MHTLSARKMEAYFEDLGLCLRWETGVVGTGWTLVGDGSAFTHVYFPSRISLWAAWLERAAKVIHDEDMCHLLLRELNASDAARRAQIIQEVRGWKAGAGSALITRIGEQARGGTPDTLPRNWKRWLRSIMEDEDRSRPFWLVCEELLDDAEALPS